MGNQINMLASVREAENNGFEVIEAGINENRLEDCFKNEELTGYYLNSEPDQRDYFLRCPQCKGLVADTGLNKSLQCDLCKKIINLPANNFDDIKQASLYNESRRRKKNICKYIKNVCSKLSFFIPFYNPKPIYALPSYKSISLFINEEKLNSSTHSGKDFSEIINNIIIPFFQFKSRIVNKDKVFEIDGIEFRVMAVNPHYLTAKVSSSTSITCKEFYSYSTPVAQVTFLTHKKREFEASEYIAQQIKNTPYPTQLAIVENLNFRINTYDVYVRNCNPKYGIITPITDVIVINRNIEGLKKIKIAVLHNNNPELNDKKNRKTIVNNYIKPYFFNGNKKYVERGDKIKIGNIEIFILKAKPTTGFIIQDITKIDIVMNCNIDECQFELNEEIENESLRNNRFSSSSQSSSVNYPILDENRLLGLHERIRLLNELFAFRGNLINLNNRNNFLENNLLNENSFTTDENLNHQDIEETLRNLPVFKIDQKFIETANREEEDNKNDQLNKCIICMEKYNINEEVKTLPCFHLFHKDCIDKWIKGNNDACPICKNKIINREDLENDNLD